MLLFFAFEYVLLELEVIRVSYRYLICLIAHRLAARNNGGEWATHYTHEQKGFWRSRALNVVTDVAKWLRAGTPQNETDAAYYTTEVICDLLESYLASFGGNKDDLVFRAERILKD